MWWSYIFGDLRIVSTGVIVTSASKSSSIIRAEGEEAPNPTPPTDIDLSRLPKLKHFSMRNNIHRSAQNFSGDFVHRLVKLVSFTGPSQIESIHLSVVVQPTAGSSLHDDFEGDDYGDGETLSSTNWLGPESLQTMHQNDWKNLKSSFSDTYFYPRLQLADFTVILNPNDCPLELDGMQYSTGSFRLSFPLCPQ